MTHAAWHVASGRGGLDDRTWRDLSMDEVFARLDRCVTALGRQVLYRRLRRGGEPDFDRQVRTFDDPEARVDFERAAKPLRLDRAEGLAALLWGRAPPLPRLASFYPLATLATVGAAAVSFVWPVAVLLVVGLVLGNIALRLQLQHAMTAYGDALTSVAALVSVARSLDGLQEAVASVDPWRRSLAWATLDASGLNELVASVVAYLNVFLLLDVNAYVASLRLVRQRADALRTMFTSIGERDAARSIALFRAEQPVWSVPAFTAAGTPVVMTGMRHPLVEGAVPNDIELGARGWLVLGSNASGKSTCLKSIALQSVLAQSIATTTCMSYAAPRLRVSTLIHVEDDLGGARSHFQVEAEAVREMLVAEAGDRLCIVDELFRGTNTAERVAAGAAVLRGLTRRGARVVAATHDDELIALLADEFDPFYFTEQVSAARLSFDYRLRAGRAAPRNAIAVLALAGVPDDVVTEARALL